MSMKAYYGQGIDTSRLLDRLPSLLDDKEELRGAIEVKVGPTNCIVVVTSQRLIHLTPDDYAVVDFIYLSFINSKKRAQDSDVHRLDIQASSTSYYYVSERAVDLMWMDRTLDQSNNEKSVSRDIKNCRTCSGQVSRLAKVCPHCGEEYPANSQTTESIITLVSVVTVAFIAYVLYTAFSGG